MTKDEQYYQIQTALVDTLNQLARTERSCQTKFLTLQREGGDWDELFSCLFEGTAQAQQALEMARRLCKERREEPQKEE